MGKRNKLIHYSRLSVSSILSHKCSREELYRRLGTRCPSHLLGAHLAIGLNSLDMLVALQSVDLVVVKCDPGGSQYQKLIV